MLREAFIRKDFPKKTKEKIVQIPQMGTKIPFFSNIEFIKQKKLIFKTNNRKNYSKKIFDGNTMANSKKLTRVPPPQILIYNWQKYHLWHKEIFKTSQIYKKSNRGKPNSELTI